MKFYNDLLPLQRPEDVNKKLKTKSTESMQRILMFLSEHQNVAKSEDRPNLRPLYSKSEIRVRLPDFMTKVMPVDKLLTMISDLIAQSAIDS